MLGPAQRSPQRTSSREVSPSAALSEGFATYPAGRPAPERLRYLASFATLAPSIAHDGAFPWKLHLVGDRLEVLETGGPSRETTISAAAALHHLRVAFNAFGEQAAVEELPLDDPRVLARVVLDRRMTMNEDAQHLLVAAARRRDTSAPFRHVLVPGRFVKMLANECRRERVVLRAIVGDERDALAARVAPERERAALLHDTPLFVALTTAGDTRADWLAAGQAFSAVLLRASMLGLSSSRLDAPVADAQARREYASALRLERVPQLVLRLGPYDGPSIPAPPRVSLADVFVVEEAPAAEATVEAAPSQRVLHS